MVAHVEVGGLRVPAFFYGTAWKEDRTEDLVSKALVAGFRAIDTANQRKHYFEEGVGRALRAALSSGLVARDALFVQTKFTFRGGQDDRLPYDPRAPVAEQVAQSFERSLEHLGLDRLDALVLHGPSRRDGLGDDDVEAWRAMETVAESGRVRLLGVSNVSAKQLGEFVELARVPVSFVQNRCYADRGWDGAVRELCERSGAVYQGFSLLTANRDVVGGTRVGAIAARHGATRAQVIFRFARALGMIPLTGTGDPAHMRLDLDALGLELAPEEIAEIRGGGGVRR